MRGTLQRTEDRKSVKIGDFDNLVVREGLQLEHLWSKTVRVTSQVANEYRGEKVTVVLGLEEDSDEYAPVAKRAKIQYESAQKKEPTPIGALSQGPSICFEGRIIQKSEVRPFKNGKGQLMTFEVEDYSGRIRCTAFNESCGRLNQLISVGNQYWFEGGTLKVANKLYNNTNSEFELTVSDRTIVEEIKREETYTEILMLSPGNTYTTRGIVLLCGDMSEYTKNDRINQRRTVIIGDESNSCIEITMFGNSETFDVGTYLKISMLKVNVWQEKTTGTISANAVSVIYTSDKNTEWFVKLYDDNRCKYEELIQPWWIGVSTDSPRPLVRAP